MKHSKQLFTHYISLWARLLQQSASTADPATHLLTHDARTPLFYLEGMTRVLMHEHNPKKMRRLNEWFKKLEDALGAMDYFAAHIKDVKNNRKIPLTYKREWQAQLTIATAQFNTLLIELGWLGEAADRLQTVHKMLKKMDWLSDKDLHTALKKRYLADIASVVHQMKNPITEIEKDIHELRRDVRWLSIYPQAFKGFVGLYTVEPAPAALIKYATTETVHSPYNQLPAVQEIKKDLRLNRHAYYAMSWLIAQLGTLKDSGLRLHAVAEQVRTHKKCSQKEALRDAQTMLGSTQPSIDDLLNTARGLVIQIQNDKAFSQLLITKDTAVVQAKPTVKTTVNAAVKATPKTRATTALKTPATKTPVTKTRTTPVSKPRTTTRATPATKTRMTSASKPRTTKAPTTPRTTTRTPTTRARKPTKPTQS